MNNRPHIRPSPPPKGSMNLVTGTTATVVRSLSAYLRGAVAMPERAPLDYPFVASDIAQLHRVRANAGTPSLDDQTWNDLLLGPYLGELSRETSIFGKQELYRRLRAGVPSAERMAGRARVEALLADPQRVGQLHRALRPLRDADTEVASMLYEGACPPIPAWAGRTWPLPLALMASIAAVVLSPLAWLGVALVLYLLISAQVRYYERVQKWKRSTAVLQMMLATCGGLGADDLVDGGSFARSREQAARINRALSRSAAGKMIPGYEEYRDWFALANVNHYFKTAQLVFAQREFLLDCFARCAALEADVALARHLLAVSAWCWAGEAGRDALALQGVVHPLLADAAPLSIALEGKGAFISGQNGVGKSTLLRTVGLSLVAARAFGFAYAREARLPDLRVYASMQNEDSLLGGESLYIAELRRARELLEAANSGAPALYLIDEIFRGTNHIESVSAATAVLDTIAARGLVLVSSHNVVLASLLARWLEPLQIAREGRGLAVRPGVLVETNGVSLLAAQGFAPEISEKAARVAEWLGKRLAEPAGEFKL
jgi:hypothetical protein